MIGGEGDLFYYLLFLKREGYCLVELYVIWFLVGFVYCSVVFLFCFVFVLFLFCVIFVFFVLLIGWLYCSIS